MFIPITKDCHDPITCHRIFRRGAGGICRLAAARKLLRSFQFHKLCDYLECANESIATPSENLESGSGAVFADHHFQPA